MKAARLYAPGDVRLLDEPVPTASAATHDRVRVTAVGICGSDLHWFGHGSIGDARLARPLVLGHEIAGVVAQGPDEGRRVAVDPAIPCGACDVCRRGDANLCPTIAFAGHGDLDGGLREYLDWPRDLLHPLPDELTDEDGALLEPLGVALHALDLGHVRVGMHVVVAGVGPIGLLLVQLLKLAGADHITVIDPLAHRRDAALRLGADDAIDPGAHHPSASSSEVAATTHGATTDRGADLGYEVTDAPDGPEAVMQAVRPGARVVLVGIPQGDRTTFRASLVRRKGLTLVLSRRMKGTYPRAIDLVQSGKIDTSALVTARFDLADVDEAFRTAAARAGLKVVVHPTASQTREGRG